MARDERSEYRRIWPSAPIRWDKAVLEPLAPKKCPECNGDGEVNGVGCPACGGTGEADG